MKHKHISPSLSVYSIVALAFGSPAVINAQIVYTDIDPDEHFITYNDDQLLIDMDDNGTNDITINQDLWKIVSFDSSSYGLSTDGWVDHDLSVFAYDVLNNNIGSVVDYAPGASALEFGEEISFGGNWNNSGFARLWYGKGEYSVWNTEFGDGSSTEFEFNEGQ